MDALQVTPDFLLVLAALFSSGWRIATSFQIPGTNLNIPEFVFACVVVLFTIKAVPFFLGFTSIFQSSSDTGDTSQNRDDGANDRGVGRW